VVSDGIGMKESDIQNDIMNALTVHPMVVWAYVTTCGTVRGRHGGRYFNAGFPGLPDIIGQLKDGRILGIEVKAPGKQPSPIQHDQLTLMRVNNGAAGWCDSVQGALDIVEGT